MARGELHVQLAVDYADDEKLADLSRSARLLYVDALCMAKRKLNDGILTQAQVNKLMYPERPAAAKRAAEELVASGAWSWNGNEKVYTITAWLKRNKSRAQIEQDRHDAEEAAALGNHRRWHEARGQRDEKCRYCRETPSPPRSGTRIGGESGSIARDRDRDRDRDKKQPPVAPRAEVRPPDDPPDGDPGPAERLITEWISGCNRRPPSRVVDDVGRLVAEMLRDGIQAADIERGIQLWQSRGSNPRALPSFVNQVMNSRSPSNVVAIHKPSTTDQRVGVALELARKYAEEDAQ